VDRRALLALAYGAMSLQWETREKAIAAGRAPDVPGRHRTVSTGVHDTALVGAWSKGSMFSG